MFCPKCGEGLKGNEKFCPKCGSTITELAENTRIPNERRKWKKIVCSIVIIIILVSGFIVYLFGRSDSTLDENKSMVNQNIEAKRQKPAEEEISENEIVAEEEDVEEKIWRQKSGSEFYNGMAFVSEYNEKTGEKRLVAIDTEEEELFVFPKDNESLGTIPFDVDYNFGGMLLQGLGPDECVDKEGEYVWYGNVSLDREGKVLYDISDKYSGDVIGNGYMLVKAKKSGYEQQKTKMGVIDGYGNEIIPIGEEFAEACGGELPRRSDRTDIDGMSFLHRFDLVIDSNQRIYYKNKNTIREYRNGNLFTYGNVLYRDGGKTVIQYGGNGSDTDTEWSLSDDVVVSVTYNKRQKENGITIQTYDLSGTLLSEKQIFDIVPKKTELHFENGLSAFYIRGTDGNYVTMIDEYGNFKFEPILCVNEHLDYLTVMYSDVSEGLLRVPKSEMETIFLNENGEEVLSLPYSIEYVGNCKNGQIVVNLGNGCFYVDVEAEIGKWKAEKEIENKHQKVEAEKENTSKQNATEKTKDNEDVMKHISRVSATSSLSEYGMTHIPERVIDGDITTGWVEGAKGQGSGETITLYFDGEYLINGMVINAGFQKDNDLYSKNSRPAEVKIAFADGESNTYTLRDIDGGQDISFGKEILTDSISLTIESVYQGTKYEDTVISEINIY